MKSLAMFLALAIAAVAAIAATQESDAAPPAGEQAATATGEVVRYDAGKTIVLRQPDNRIVTYEIAPTLIVPIEVQVGKHVTIRTETAADGAVRVTSITTLTADVAPSGGQLKQTTTYTHDAGKPGESKAVIVSGDVVRYEAGKTIVLRTDGRDVTYTIAPEATAPAPEGITVGRKVSIVTEPSPAGPVLVTRISTETLTPAGALPTTTGKTTAVAAGSEGAASKTEFATVYGTVSAYEPGRSLTVLRPNGTTETYSLDADSALPTKLAAGKKVVVRTVSRPGSDRPLVRKVTYSTRTVKTTK